MKTQFFQTLLLGACVLSSLTPPATHAAVVINTDNTTWRQSDQNPGYVSLRVSFIGVECSNEGEPVHKKDDPIVVSEGLKSDILPGDKSENITAEGSSATQLGQWLNAGSKRGVQVVATVVYPSDPSHPTERRKVLTAKKNICEADALEIANSAATILSPHPLS